VWTRASREVISWKWVGGSLLLGGVVLLVGPVLGGPYVQSVATNIGTAILLFGILALGERRLTKVVEGRLGRPNTLEEAKTSVAELLQRRYSQMDQGGALDGKLENTIRRIARHLQAAGLVQIKPGHDSARVVYHDRYGGDVVWAVDFANFRLSHQIEIAERERFLSPEIVVDTEGSRVDIDLDIFERQVFEGLLLVIASIEPKYGSPERWVRPGWAEGSRELGH
jgi:hypothetical protein